MRLTTPVTVTKGLKDFTQGRNGAAEDAVLLLIFCHVYPELYFNFAGAFQMSSTMALLKKIEVCIKWLSPGTAVPEK